MKKVLSVLLSIVFILSIMPLGLFSITASAATEGYYTYSISNDKAIIIDVNTSISGDITIPTTLGEYPVTKISSYAFKECTQITSVIIPEGITHIGDYAFEDCERLNSATIPSSVTTIGRGIFYWCSALYELTFKAEIVPSSAFSATDLRKIYFSKNLTTIGESAFYAADYLQGVYYEGTEEEWAKVRIEDENNPIYKAKKYFNCTGFLDYSPGPVEDYLTYSVSNGEATITGCDETFIGDITIPSTLGGYPVTSVAGNAFYNCNRITGITFEGDIKNIGEYAFYYCTKVENITFNGDVGTIGSSAFWSCSNLSTLIFKGNVGVIYSAFFECSSLKSVIFNGDVGTIGDYAFAHASALESITFRGNVGTIGDDAFNYASALESITFGGDVITIGKDAFFECSSLKSVIFNGDVGTIGEYAFSSFSLKSVIFNGDVGTIGDYAFSSSSLKSVIFNGDVGTIGDYAFAHASALESITFGGNVGTIGEYAFSDCFNLKTVWYSGSRDDRKNIIIHNYNSDLEDAKWYYNICKTEHIYSADCDAVCNNCDYERTTSADHVYTDSDDINCNVCNEIKTPLTDGYYTYTIRKGKAAIIGVNSSISGDIVIPSTLGGYPVTSIENDAFSHSWITSIEIPDSVTSIGDWAFEGCSSLQSIVIGESVTEIGSYAFYECDSLKSITIPESLSSIGSDAFISSSIKDVYITNLEAWCYIEFGNSYANPLLYADNLYLNNQPVKDIIIPQGTSKINKYAFRGYSLESLTIPGSVSDIGDNAFDTCERLKKVIIHEGVTRIGWQTFNSCIRLESITMPKSVVEIDDYAFSDCDALKYVFYAGTEQDKSNITIGSVNNSRIKYAFWHYNETDHVYDDDCDVECNICKYIRTVDHSYTNSCDTDCNYCGHIRTITHSYKTSWVKDSNEHWYECSVCGDKKSVAAHVYTNDCDTTCNVCYQTRTVPDHVYTNSCDATCNVCYASRPITHQYEWIIELEENCGNNGQKYEKCSVCHTIRNAQTVIPATGKHTYDNDCDKDCNVCQQIRVTREHDYVWVVDKSENCGVSGEKHAECSICQSKQFAGTVIPATGNHIYDNDCDTHCNICESVRTVADHSYTLNGNNTCDICKYSKVPQAPTIETKSPSSVTLVLIEGMEYSLDGIVWQSSNIFEGLSINVKYTFYQRVAESAASFVSEVSEGTVAILFALGDVNGDAVVSDADAGYLLMHTFYQDIYPVNQDCDFNKDGKVSDADAIYLLMHTFYQSTYPLY